MFSTNEFVYKKWNRMPHAFKPIFVMIKILITFFFNNFEVVHTLTNTFGKVGSIITSKQ
jgi:hypothetical protein